MSRQSKLNRYERIATHKAKMEYQTHGEGVYVFRNHTNGELMLPKPLAGGKTRVNKGEEFQGDSYFLSLVKCNMLTLVREIQSPQAQRLDIEKVKLMEQQKLLTEQPQIVTAHGKVEHVVTEQPKAAKKVIGEHKTGGPVLLNETGNLDGVEIMS